MASRILIRLPHLRSTISSCALTGGLSVRTGAMKIDSHLHVWANEEESSEFPYTQQRPPTVAGNVDYLVELMSKRGIDMAMIVQSATHGFDHAYVKSAMERHPEKFLGCLLANPDDSGRGVSEMERLVKEEGFKCVRFNPYIWPEGQKMTNEIGRSLFQKAGDLHVPVGFMLFNGLLEHVEEIELLCTEYPETVVILDHFGFAKSENAAWDKLMEWAKYPQIYVKASAFFRNSKEKFPYLDLRKNFRRVVDAYGAERMLWGTDFPWVISECGYANAWNIVDEWERITQETILSKEEKELIMGKSLQNLLS